MHGQLVPKSHWGPSVTSSAAKRRWLPGRLGVDGAERWTVFVRPVVIERVAENGGWCFESDNKRRTTHVNICWYMCIYIYRCCLYIFYLWVMCCPFQWWTHSVEWKRAEKQERRNAKITLWSFHALSLQAKWTGCVSSIFQHVHPSSVLLEMILTDWYFSSW